MNEYNEWKTEKCHKRINMGKIQMSLIMMATVRQVTAGLGLRQFLAEFYFCVSVHRRKEKKRKEKKRKEKKKKTPNNPT